MAKQIKVFNGAGTGNFIIYTVPVGRIAQVKLLYVSLVNGNGNYSASLIVNNNNYGTIPQQGSAPAGGVGGGGENSLVGLSTFGGTFNFSIPQTVYLNAGQTYGINALVNTNTVYYNVLVIEEF